MTDKERMQEKEQHYSHVSQGFCQVCGELRKVSYYLFLNDIYVNSHICSECREAYERWREK